jgi:DNA-binding CsgD family transcriptional regulator
MRIVEGRPALTDRERQILELIWRGLRSREISLRLQISIKTVEAHRASMKMKLAVHNTAQLLKTALEAGDICRSEATPRAERIRSRQRGVSRKLSVPA